MKIKSLQMAKGVNSLHGGQVTKDDVHSVNGVSADRFLQVYRLGHGASRQDFVQHVPADQWHKLDGDFKWAVLPAITWQGDIQINLKWETRVSVACWSMVKKYMFFQATLNITLTLVQHKWEPIFKVFNWQNLTWKRHKKLTWAVVCSSFVSLTFFLKLNFDFCT